MDREYGDKTPNDGAYVITEQGDLGLGLTAINEGQEEDPKKDSTPNLV